MVGPLGIYRPDATVALTWIDPESGTETTVDRRSNTRSAGFRVESNRVGSHRLSVSAAGCRTEVEQFEVALPGARLERLVRLATEAVVPIRGGFLADDGRPLTRDELDFLVPEVDGQGLVAWHHARGARTAGFAASIERETATYEIGVPAGFQGVVSLEWLGATLIAEPWRDGDGALDLGVSFDRLRAWLGTLDVFTDRLLDVRVYRRGEPSVWPGLELVGAMDEAEGRVLFDLPPGDYVLMTKPAGAAALASEIRIDEGRTVRIPVEPRPPTSGRVLLDGLSPEEVTGFVQDVRVGTPEGMPLPARVTLDPADGPTALLIEDAPAGELVLRARGNVLRTTLGADGGDPVWEIGPLSLAWTPISTGRSLSDPRPERVEARIRLESTDGILVDETYVELEFDAQGISRVPIRFVPGRYDLRIDIEALDCSWLMDAVLAATDDGRVILFGEFLDD